LWRMSWAHSRTLCARVYVCAHCTLQPKHLRYEDENLIAATPSEPNFSPTVSESSAPPSAKAPELRMSRKIEVIDAIVRKAFNIQYNSIVRMAVGHQHSINSSIVATPRRTYHRIHGSRCYRLGKCLSKI